MKKSFLTLASLVMVLGLVGCTGQGASQEQKSGSQEGSEGSGSQGSEVVPVVEGKVTVYLTAHFSGVELPDYAAINLAGGFTSWNQGHPEETQLTKLEGTDIFYIQVAAPAAGDVTYKVILGYTEASGLSGADLGVNWGNEAKGYPVDQFGPGEGGNKTLAFAGTETTVNLGDYTWETMLDEPSPDYYDIDLYVDFFEDVPTGYHVYVMGAFNGWASAIELEKDTEAEGVRYHFEMEDVLAKEYEFKALVHPTAKDAEGFNPWSDDRWEVVPGANSKFTVNALCAESQRNLFGGTKKFHVANQMTDVVAAAANTEVSFTGKVFAAYDKNPYNGVYVGDRENAIMVYKTPNATDPMPKVGDTVKVEGQISIYKDQREVVPAEGKTLITVVADENQVVNYQDVNADFVSGLASATKVDVMNKALHFKGTVATADSKDAEGEVEIQLAIAEGVTFPLYAKNNKDAEATVTALEALKVGDEIEVWGALSAYNTTYQFVCPFLAE